MGLSRKHIDALYRGMCYFFAFSIAFPHNLSVWVFALWGFLFLGRKIADSIVARRIVFAPKERHYLPCLLLVVFSLLGLLSACVADEPNLVFQRVFGPKLALLLLPLFALMDDEQVDFSTILRYFILGNIVFIDYSILVVCFKYWVNDDIELHRNLLRCFTEVCCSIVHRTYSGVNILISYVALFYLLGRERVTKGYSVFIFVYLIFTLLFLVLNNSRIITLAALLLWIGFGICYLMRGKKRLMLLLMGGLLLLLGLFVVVPSRTKDLVKNGQLTEKLMQDPRARIWPEAYSLGMERPWMGYGLNNITERLVERYLAADFLEGAAQKYGPHNEYLNTWLQMGVLGLLFFIALLMAIPWSAPAERRAFAIFFTLLFAFVFLTESMLDRYNGCLTFAFFVALLAKRDKKVDEGTSLGKAGWILLGLLMLLPMVSFAVTRVANRLGGPSSIIREDLFPPCCAYKVQPRDVVSFIHGARCVSYLPVAYCDLPDNEHLRFEIDCVASDEFDGSTVKIIAEEDMPDGSVRPTECYYDLGRKEEQQLLSVDVTGKRTIIVYLFGDAKLSFEELQGDVILLNPRFVTN